MSGVGDVDGDGYGDLLAGASGEDPERVYAFSGATGALLHTLESPGPPGGHDSDEFGARVSGVADMDRDGRGDLLIGAYEESPGTSPADAGRAYVFSGDRVAPLLEVASIEPPVEIPPEGGSFAFTATLTSQSASADTWEVWADGTGPLGEPAFGLGPVSVTLQVGEDTTLVLEQEVAAAVPPGEYA